MSDICVCDQCGLQYELGDMDRLGNIRMMDDDKEEIGRVRVGVDGVICPACVLAAVRGVYDRLGARIGEDAELKLIAREREAEKARMERVKINTGSSH